MAITSTLIGSLGGTSVGSRGISWDTDGLPIGVNVIETINLSSVGKYRVVVIGDETKLSTTVSQSSWPVVMCNSTELGPVGTSTSSAKMSMFGITLVLDSVNSFTIAVNKKNTSASYRSIWNGTVFWWSEP